MEQRKTQAEFRAEILTALSGMDGEPEELVWVDGAAAHLYADQDSNAPDAFWTVVRKFRR